MDSKNLSIYALEKKAGLNRSAVRNILQGLSKKPSAEVLMSIAEVLECSVDDLMGSLEENNTLHNKIKTTTRTKNQHPWNENLYIDAVKIVSQHIKDKEQNHKSEKLINLINEVYKYSLEKKSSGIDKDFTKWLVDKNVQ